MVRGLAYSGNRTQAMTDISDSDNTAYLRERFLMAKTRADEIKRWVSLYNNFFLGTWSKANQGAPIPLKSMTILAEPLFF